MLVIECVHVCVLGEKIVSKTQREKAFVLQVVILFALSWCRYRTCMLNVHNVVRVLYILLCPNDPM